jgi:hypothetical protein
MGTVWMTMRQSSSVLRHCYGRAGETARPTNTGVFPPERFSPKMYKLQGMAALQHIPWSLVRATAGSPQVIIDHNDFGKPHSCLGQAQYLVGLRSRTSLEARHCVARVCSPTAPSRSRVIRMSVSDAQLLKSLCLVARRIAPYGSQLSRNGWRRIVRNFSGATRRGSDR